MLWDKRCVRRSEVVQCEARPGAASRPRSPRRYPLGWRTRPPESSAGPDTSKRAAIAGCGDEGADPPPPPPPERPGRGPCPLPAFPPGEGSLPRDSTAVTAALRADTGGQGGVCCLFWRQV